MSLSLNRIREVKSLGKLFVVDLILRIYWEDSDNFYQLTQGQSNANLSKDVLELCLIDKSTVSVVIKAKSIEQFIFKDLIIDHFPLYSANEFIFPFFININFFIFNAADI